MWKKTVKIRVFHFLSTLCGKPYVNLWIKKLPFDEKKKGKKFIFFIDENKQSAYNGDDVLLLIKQGIIIDKGGAYQ